MGRPEGVQVVRGDSGEVIPCELVHEGVNEDGMDVWRVAGVTVRPYLDQLKVAVLPPRTSISVDFVSQSQKPRP